MTSAITNNQYTFKKPRRQYFAFPSDVISHLFMNPKSGNGLEKLYQTCKYFFSKRKILVINQRGHLKDNFLNSTSIVNDAFVKCKIDIRKSQALIWPLGALQICAPLSTDFKNIYRCSVWTLAIYDITLSYDEFEFLVSEETVKIFHFFDASIYYSNGKYVTLDIILKKLPKIVDLWYRNRNENLSAKTLLKMTEIPLNMNLNYCVLYIVDISNDFNPALLCKFFEQHPKCCYKIYIPRSSEIKQRIENVLKEISKTDQTKEYIVTILI